MSGWISTRRQKKKNRVRSWGDKQQQDKKAGYLEKIMKTIDGFEDENGNLPRGTIKRIIKEEQLNLPWLSGHQIYSLRKRRVETKRHEAKMALLANNFDTTEITENTKEINETSDISPSLHDDECSFDSFGSENCFYDIEQIATAGTIIIPFDFKTTVGRKKGSSSDAKAVAKRRSSELVDEIATTWYEIAFDVGDNTKLFELITIRKHMARSDQYISENTIRSRVKRRNTSDVHQGRTSPMCKAEPTLCCLLKYASRMGQHVTQSECIAMANELIKDRPIGKEVAAWKLKYVHACRERFQFDSNYYPKAEVGWGWFRGFQRRYSEITLKYVSNIKHYRSTWSTYAMLENMYKDVYAQFAKWGVAYKNDKPEWQDEFGNKVEKEDAMGAPVEYEMLWPDRVLTMDETGDRGNQADDPATRGDKVICETDGTQPKKGAAVDDSSWTVQGFTTLSGRAVLMVIIMKKASILDYNEYHGYDLEAPWIGDGEDVCVDGELPTQEQINRNKGAYRRFPGALTIEFNGIKIPSLVFATKGGGVNEDILVEALEHLDKLNVFPRKEGVPNPTLLVDGHGSRLQPKFVQYVNNLKADFSPDDEADHKWNVAIGLPHSTHHWQVGDSPEENQAFKFHSRVKKDKIVKFQAQLSITPQIKRYHAVPICNYAFRRSFMRCDSVKRAIAERGWNPCNMNCLYSKEVIQTQVSTALTDERKDLTAAELACIKY